MNEAETVKAGLDHIRGQVDQFATAQKARLGEVSEKQGEFTARLLEVEQKLARRGSGDPGTTYGTDSGALHSLLEASTELAAVSARKSKRAVIELPGGFFKAQITSTGIAYPDQRPEIVAPAQRRLTLRSLIPHLPTSGGSVQYLQETGFDNQTSPVSETTTKPESNITFELKTAAVVTLAHWIRISAQALADIPQMMAYINGRLRYGLGYVEDLQLLRGSGVGNNLTGLLIGATAYNRNTAGDTKADEIRRAITQLELVDHVATGIVLNPADWEEIALAKESGTGGYIMAPGAPGGMVPTTLWGLPVVSTPAMTANDWMVGDFLQAAVVFDREEARVDISTETDDDFVTNRAHVRAEERLALAILRPGALIEGDFTES